MAGPTAAGGTGSIDLRAERERERPESSTDSLLQSRRRSGMRQVLTGSTGGSLGSKMEGEEEEGGAAATDTSVRSLAGAACGDMAVDEHPERLCQWQLSYSFMA